MTCVERAVGGGGVRGGQTLAHRCSNYSIEGSTDFQGFLKLAINRQGHQPTRIADTLKQLPCARMISRAGGNAKDLPNPLFLVGDPPDYSNDIKKIMKMCRLRFGSPFLSSVSSITAETRCGPHPLT